MSLEISGEEDIINVCVGIKLTSSNIVRNYFLATKKYHQSRNYLPNKLEIKMLVFLALDSE